MSSANFYKKIPKHYLLCFFSTLVWGLVAHGMTLFNKYSLYEDVSQLFGVGATYQSGRWMLDILHRMEVFLFGGSYSLPLLNGLATMVYIGLIACLILYLLDMKGMLSGIALGGILVTTPVLTGTFGYMFTAPHYAFGLLMGVLGTVLICKYPKWFIGLGGAALIACAIGVYQANLTTVLFLMLLWFIHRTYSAEGTGKTEFLRIGSLLVAFVTALALYFIINKLYLQLFDAALTSYQGIDTAGKLPLTTYLKRGVLAYKRFLLPDRTSSAFMYYGGMMLIYRIAQLAAIATTVILLVKCKHILKAIIILLAAALLPLAMNFIYVMCEEEQIHSLMVYSHVMLFVFLLWTSATVFDGTKKFGKACCTIACGATLLLSGLYVRYDNICYLKAEFVQTQTISYFNTLITQIKSTEGYRDDMPVNFINFDDKQDATLTDNQGFDGISTIPYHDTDVMINSFASRSFIRYWCGFDPDYDYTNYSDDPTVQAMPCYPDSGSIIILNDTVIIKFAP